MSCLPFEVIVGDLDISELQLHRPVGFSQRRDFFLEGILCIVRFGLGLLILGLGQNGRVSERAP